jgi:hypothetical protein
MNRDGVGFGSRAFVMMLVIFVLAVGAIFFIINGGNKGGSAPDGSPKVTDLRTERSVRMTVGGNITADELYDSYTIEIGPSQRIVTLKKGYQGNIVKQQIYTNNPKAYEQFVYALDRQNFTVSRPSSGRQVDERGACAIGRRYNFDILNNGSSILSLWTTSCSGSSGTFMASVDSVKPLFDNQIPDLDDILRNIKL